MILFVSELTSWSLNPALELSFTDAIIPRLIGEKLRLYIPDCNCLGSILSMVKKIIGLEPNSPRKTNNGWRYWIWELSKQEMRWRFPENDKTHVVSLFSVCSGEIIFILNCPLKFSSIEYIMYFVLCDPELD